MNCNFNVRAVLMAACVPLLLAASPVVKAQTLGGAGPIVLGIDDGHGASATDIFPVGISPYGFDPGELVITHGSDQFDLHGDYTSNVGLAPGVSMTKNFNFTGGEGAPPSYVGDTLSVTFTGQQPINGGDPDNLSVDLHFRSDEIGPPTPLIGGPTTMLFTVPEVPGFINLDSYFATNGGPNNPGITDFHLSVQSQLPTPEPGAAGLLAAGLISATGILLRRSRCKRTSSSK